MQQTRLIKILNWFDQKKMNALDKFIRSPYFNNNSSILILWDYLENIFPNFNKLPKTDEEIFNKSLKKADSNRKYSDRTIRQLRFQLTKLVEEFLIIEEIRNRDNQKDALLADAYFELQLQQPLEKIYKSKLSLKGEVEKESINTFLERMQWLKLKYYSEKESKIIADPKPIKNIDNALDLFYIGAKLKYACELASWEKIMNVEHDIFLEQEIINYCKINETKLPNFHYLFFKALTLINEPSDNSFMELKVRFLTKEKNLENDERIILFAYLLNFTFLRIQEHQDSYLQEAFDLYKYGIDNLLLIVNDKFLADHFLNLISIGCALKELDWIDAFLNNLDKKLKDSIDASTYNSAIGRLEFEKENFDAALKYLEQVDHKNIVHSFKSRYLTIACYFELEEPINFIRSHCQSFLIFVSRRLSNKNDMVEGSKNFVRCIRELLKETPDKAKLLDNLNSKSKFLIKSWLLSKIEDLE